MRSYIHLSMRPLVDAARVNPPEYLMRSLRATPGYQTIAQTTVNSKMTQAMG